MQALSGSYGRKAASLLSVITTRSRQHEYACNKSGVTHATPAAVVTHAVCSVECGGARGQGQGRSGARRGAARTAQRQRTVAAAGDTTAADAAEPPAGARGGDTGANATTWSAGNNGCGRNSSDNDGGARLVSVPHDPQRTVAALQSDVHQSQQDIRVQVRPSGGICDASAALRN